MAPIKEDGKRILELLPEDASLEDIQYRIYVCQNIESGLDDVGAGRTISEAAFQARMARWLEP